MEEIIGKKSDKEKSLQKIMFKLIIVISVFLVSFGIVVLSRMNNKNSETIIGTEINELRDTLMIETAKNGELLKKMQEKQKELEDIKEKIAQKNTVVDIKKKEIEENNMKLGLTTLKGEGIELILKDGEDKKKFGSEALQIIVHDTDILGIVNILRNAGAEAISINGQRIIATTPISCIGTVIKINDEKIGGPYIIKAIGNSEYLQTALNIPGGNLQILESSGIGVELKKETNIEVPKYTGVYNMDYLKIKK